MKKSFLLLPITVAILTACSSDAPAPVENADGTLSPGIMQPVDNPSMGGNTSWEPQIQQSSVPNSMNGPIPQTPAQPAQSAPQPNFQPTSQEFTIPRNPETNAPDYSQINKGFYKGDTYTVRKGDTMFLIAYISGLDVKELAALNNLSEPYQLNVGQMMKISSNRPQNVAPSAAVNTPAAAPQVTTPTAPESKPAEPVVTYTPGANGTQYGSDGTITGPVKATVGRQKMCRTLHKTHRYSHLLQLSRLQTQHQPIPVSYGIGRQTAALFKVSPMLTEATKGLILAVLKVKRLMLPPVVKWFTPAMRCVVMVI